MLETDDQVFQRIERLHSDGLVAARHGRFGEAIIAFANMDKAAHRRNFARQRLDALQPLAKALWSTGEYGEARSVLAKAGNVAKGLELTDELGMIASNKGRCAAHEVVHSGRFHRLRQSAALRRLALPHFQQAFETLDGHDHFYFRYANDQHGSLAAALGNERELAFELITDGLAVAGRISPEPYDQQRTYAINPNGLGQMALAGAVLLSGSEHLADYATRYVR